MSAEVLFAPVQPDEPLASRAGKVRRLYERLGAGRLVSRDDLVAIKTHFGEQGNTTHVSPDLVRTFVDLVKEGGGLPYLTETSVLYKSRRMNAVSHILQAYAHGFTFERVGAPIVMCDGLRGNLDREVVLEGAEGGTVSIAADAAAAALVLVSHATGHLGTGFGAALKNLGMGLSARKGKLSQHSASHPFVQEAVCTGCGACLRGCPVDALEMVAGKARIQDETCIGCGECLTLCTFNAIGFRWDGASAELQRKMVEHAAAVAKALEGRLVCFNFLTDMTRDCDCLGASPTVLPDIGILASWDPVAIDAATLALTKERAGRDLAGLSYPALDPMVQIRHAARLGVGSPDYRLVEV